MRFFAKQVIRNTHHWLQALIKARDKHHGLQPTVNRSTGIALSLMAEATAEKNKRLNSTTPTIEQVMPA